LKGRSRRTPPTLYFVAICVAIALSSTLFARG
jgi:hypothetical protein